jgi:hypothetical protein
VQWRTGSVHVLGLAEYDFAQRHICNDGDGDGHDNWIAGSDTADWYPRADEHEGSAEAADSCTPGIVGAGGLKLSAAAPRTTPPVGADLGTSSAGVLGNDDKFLRRGFGRE